MKQATPNTETQSKKTSTKRSQNKEVHIKTVLKYRGVHITSMKHDLPAVRQHQSSQSESRLHWRLLQPPLLHLPHLPPRCLAGCQRWMLCCHVGQRDSPDLPVAQNFLGLLTVAGVVVVVAHQLWWRKETVIDTLPHCAYPNLNVTPTLPN